MLAANYRKGTGTRAGAVVNAEQGNEHAFWFG
jgi:hypothetical protein